MKIWVPGAAGMLGKHLLDVLNEKQISHIGNDVLDVDIADLEAIREFVNQEKITHVINCAAYTQVDAAESEPELAKKINVTGSENLGLISKEFSLPIIHFSTDYIFDGAAKKPYKEEDSTSPLGIYGLSKWQGEKALLAHTPHACIIRTSWLFGLYGKNFVLTMLKLMQEKESLNIVSDQIGRPTYAHDLALAAVAMLNQTGVFHFANSGKTNWHDFAKEIYQYGLSLGYPFTLKTLTPITSVEYPTPAKRPLYSVLDTAKIEEELGQKPRTWKKALAEMLRAHKMQEKNSYAAAAQI